MEITELIATLTEGLPAEQAAQVRAAIERDAVKTKVTGWKQQNEYDTLQRRTAELQAALEGDQSSGKVGALEYQRWYDANFASIKKLEGDVAKYQEKYGTLEAPTVQQPSGKQYSDEDIQRLVDARIQGAYAPKWSEILTDTGSVVQKHLRAGRKDDVDFKKLAEISQSKGMTLAQAYEEWDAPARKAADEEAREKEIQRRVSEEMQRRGASMNFPAAIDSTSSSLSQRPEAETKQFDRGSLMKDLVSTWVSTERAQ